MPEQEIAIWAQIVGGAGAGVVAVATVLVWPVVRYVRRIRDWRTETAERIRTLETSVEATVSVAQLGETVNTAITALAERLDATIERVMRECNTKLDRHIEDDTRKFTEVFDQGREVLKEVSTLSGMIGGMSTALRMPKEG